jgi:hypothetical protein
MFFCTEICEGQAAARSVTKNQARYLWSQFNAFGIRVIEPFEIPSEKPTLLLEIIHSFINQLGYGREELAATLHLFSNDFATFYLENEKNLRIVR